MFNHLPHPDNPLAPLCGNSDGRVVADGGKVSCVACIEQTVATKHGVYYGTRPLDDGGWGIVVIAFRNGDWVETNENTQPWPGERYARDAAFRAANEMAERENLPVRY